LPLSAVARRGLAPRFSYRRSGWPAGLAAVRESTAPGLLPPWIWQTLSTWGAGFR